MSQRILGEIAKQEIRDAIIGLKGAAAQAQITALAKRYQVSRGYLYEMTRDLRPRRKQRADKGRQMEYWKEHPDVTEAMKLVHTLNMAPEIAISTVEKQECADGGLGFCFPVSLGHFQRLLRQCGLHRAAERRNATAYRAWEAKAPGELFQVDFSTVKERWVERDTRRTLRVTKLEVSKNHPNTDPNRVRLWRFLVKDDCSRKIFLRYRDCDAPNASNVLDFIVEAFRELGVPLVLYSDKDGVLRCKRMVRAASILDRVYAESGGFRLLQHTAGNPRATGKVESGHKFVEEYEKLIGVNNRARTMEEMSLFSQELEDFYNWRIHRATGRRPGEIWQASEAALRMPPPKTLESAFKADEFPCRITAKVTIEFKGLEYQLPRSRPFTDWTEQKVLVIWPPDKEYFWLVGLDGKDYEIPRVLAGRDEAGQFKKPEESTRQIMSKKLKAADKAKRRQLTENASDALVPGFELPLSKRPPAQMPKKKIEPTLAEWANLGPGAVLPSFAGRPLTEYAAKQLLISEGVFSTPIAPEQLTWLREVFAGREELLDTELREQLAARDMKAALNQRVVEIRSA